MINPKTTISELEAQIREEEQKLKQQFEQELKQRKPSRAIVDPREEPIKSLFDSSDPTESVAQPEETLASETPPSEEGVDFHRHMEQALRKKIEQELKEQFKPTPSWSAPASQSGKNKESSPAKKNKEHTTTLTTTDSNDILSTVVKLCLQKKTASVINEDEHGQAKSIVLVERGQIIGVKLFHADTYTALAAFLGFLEHKWLMGEHTLERLLNEAQSSEPHAETLVGQMLINAQTPRAWAHILMEQGLLKAEELFISVRAYYFDAVQTLLAEEAHHIRVDASLVLATGEYHKVAWPMSLFSLLYETCRRHFDLSRLMALLGPPSSRIHAVYSSEIAQATLNTEAREFAATLRSGQSIEEIIFAHNSDEYYSYSLLFVLNRLLLVDITADTQTTASDWLRQGLKIDELRIQEHYKRALKDDYFSLLGVSAAATAYQIESALKRAQQFFVKTRFNTRLQQQYQQELKIINEVLNDAEYVMKNELLRANYLS